MAEEASAVGGERRVKEQRKREKDILAWPLPRSGLGFRESAAGSHGGRSGNDGLVVLGTGRKEEDDAELANGVRKFTDRGEECRGDHGGISGEAARTGAACTELPARLGGGICKMHRNRINEVPTAERLVRWWECRWE